MNRHIIQATPIALVLALIVSWIVSDDALAVGPRDIKTYRELRYQGVIAQSEWYTCGPAAVATLLTHYFEIPTTEAEILDLAFQFEQEEAFHTGFSLLALKQAMLEKNIVSKGYHLSMDALIDYYQRGGLPLIVHVTRPEVHFAVAVGMVGNEIVLADPSTGLHAISWRALVRDKGFNGDVLLAIPDVSLIEIVMNRQHRVLQQFADRHAQLASLGGRL